jgi:hypothetical protein
MADPLPLAAALAELIAVRGYARRQASSDLETAWQAAAGPEWSGRTRAAKVTRGVLIVDVTSSSALSELTAFHGPALTLAVQQQAPQLRIKSIKFRLA